MMTASGYKPQPKETPATIADLISVKEALAGLLLEETGLMDRMQINKVGELQERKLKLTGLMERYMRYLTQHKEVLAQIRPEEKAELQRVSDIFRTAMKRNYDTLLVAREVNRTVVKCVTQMFTKKDSNPIYNAHGIAGLHKPSPLSVTLNQTI
jgi:hypothetical protein